MDDLKQKVLLVEDEVDEREAMASKLRSAGYHVFEARNGKEAYAIAQNDMPHLIISDIVMPEMDGGHLLKKLRESYFGRDIAFVVITARPHMRDYFEVMGVDDFIVKPCSPDEFIHRVNIVLARPRPSVHTKSSRRVLVVGNDDTCLNTMVKLLNDQGCHTDCVMLAEQVVYKSVMFSPEVVILEAQMPAGMSSPEIVHVLRQMSRLRKIPILIYSFYPKSGHKVSEVLQREANVTAAVSSCLENGATEYIGRFDETTFIAHTERYLKKGKVFIIEDDRGLVLLLKEDLVRDGYIVRMALTGEEGMAAIEIEKPNLILLDIVLPGINGYDVLGRLKNNPSTKNIPVVMMTIKGEHNEIQRALDLGADDYIVKPFYLGLLKKRVASWIDIK